MIEYIQDVTDDSTIHIYFLWTYSRVMCQFKIDVKTSDPAPRVYKFYICPPPPPHPTTSRMNI